MSSHPPHDALLPAWRALPAPVRALLLGECLGLLSTASMQVAVSWWISRHAGAAGLARYAALMGLVALVVTPLLSPAGDRWPKRRVIRIGRLMLVLDAAALAALCTAGRFDLGLLALCGLVSAAATALLWPVESSLLAELVAPEGLSTAIRWRRAAQSVGGLAGPALGGGVIAALGLDAAMAIDLGLFALAAAVAWRAAPAAGPAAAAARRPWLADLADGLRAKWQVRLDRWWTLAGAAMMLSLLPASGLLLPLRIQSLGLSAAWFGACSAALSLGVLAGVAGVAPWLVARHGRVGALALAILACGAAIAGLALCDAAPGLVALFALMGLGLSVTQWVGQTHRLLAMPAAYRARMSAAHLTVAHAVAALAPALAGGLLQHLPVSGVYGVLAVGFAASGLLLLAVPGLGPFLRQEPRAVEGWYQRAYPGAFRARATAPAEPRHGQARRR
ncbi:MFS transporter [Piscinibacter sakaiensis]|uniref:Drug transport protein n=1 Tax=Piscinibacter sakaiensis TaxID=1547922 RepID=A0A0K8NVB8_PISS1|nr:MFS transporter [Piscinibacter sakaiensis]GAP34323.1 drug transport protein [Piscinibacter sakaiensis]